MRDSRRRVHGQMSDTTKMQKIGKVESPVVGRTVEKRKAASSGKAAVRWGVTNAALAAAMFCELSYGPSMFFGIVTPLSWYIALTLFIIFSLNTLYHLMKYLSIRYGSGFVELNPYQWKLLRVNNNEPGFRTPPPKAAGSASSASPGLTITPSYSPHQAASFLGASPYSPTNSPFPLTPTAGPQGAAGYSPVGSLSPSPKAGQRSPISPGGHSGNYARNLSMLNQSTSFGPTNPNSSFASYGANQSTSFGPGNLSASFHNHSMLGKSFNRSGSVASPNSSMYRGADDSSGLRSRFHVKNSPLRSEDCMTDLRELDDFLRQQEGKEMRSHIGSPEQSTGTGPSFWNFNRSVSDYSPMLRKYQYQLACRSTQSTKAKDDDNDDGPAQYEAHEVWLRAGVHVDDVDVWIEHLRKWLGQTIMARLVHEIEAVNNALVRVGCDDTQIGEVGISHLKQLAYTKGESVSSLNSLLPFLEVSSNQEYLVQRIKELGTGGCMSDFKWNGGSTYKGKPWAENQKSDAEIVMHMFCCYMDARLPAHPKYYGKTFSTQHFIKTPQKPDLEKKENLLIWQTKINPPHYKVVIGDDTWNLPKGRNNLFYALLLFLYQIKEKQHGMLGRVNLGMSGINVLWILDTHL